MSTNTRRLQLSGRCRVR